MKKSEALKTLGLSEGASEDDIKKAHRKLVIENHPDKFGQDAQARAAAEEKTKLINEARDVLLNHSWEPEYATAGTPYGAPFSYNPYGTSPQGSAQGNPFAGFPFDSFVWTTWDSEGNQHTYTSGNPFGTQQSPFNGAGSSDFDPFKTTNPYNSSNPFSSFFSSMYDQPPTPEQQMKEAKDDLALDGKFIAVKLIMLLGCILLGNVPTGLYLYTIVSIGQGIWKRLNFLSLVFVVPFAMLAIIFTPNANTTIGLIAYIFFFCAICFDVQNVYRHLVRIQALKKAQKGTKAKE